MLSDFQCGYCRRLSEELVKLGASIGETEDGFIIEGTQALKGATVDGHDDHRLSMSLVVVGLAASGETTPSGLYRLEGTIGFRLPFELR